MQYKIDFPGFENRSLTLHSVGIFSRAKLTIDGKPAPAGPKPRTLLLHRNDGTDVIACIRYSVDNLLGDPVPILQIGKEFIRVEKPYKWYEWAWAAMPILMVFLSGLPGFLIGAMAMQINVFVLRLFKNDLARILISGITSILAMLIALMAHNH